MIAISELIESEIEISFHNANFSIDKDVHEFYNQHIGGILMENNFHGNLKEARMTRKMTQKEVAEKIGVAKSTYSLYESGNREPGVAVIKKIATVLNVSGDELIGINEKEDFLIQKSITEPEKNLLFKYRSIDDKGKHTVDTVLEMEYIRCKSDDAVFTNE